MAEQETTPDPIAVAQAQFKAANLAAAEYQLLHPLADHMTGQLASLIDNAQAFGRQLTEAHNQQRHIDKPGSIGAMITRLTQKSA